MNAVMLSAFLDELEKIADVPVRTKEEGLQGGTLKTTGRSIAPRATPTRLNTINVGREAKAFAPPAPRPPLPPYLTPLKSREEYLKAIGPKG